MNLKTSMPVVKSTFSVYVFFYLSYVMSNELSAENIAAK